MDLSKLFGSKTKTDIMKYLLFRKQGISMRAIESEIWWTFPVIKTQVENLETAGLLHIVREKGSWELYMQEDVFEPLRGLFFAALKSEILEIFESHEWAINQQFWGTMFGKDIWSDIVILHNSCEKKLLDTIKSQMNEIFATYRIDAVSIVFMSKNEWDRRCRLADKFALRVMTAYKTIGENK